jgi:outer membrane receptor protein involved in Fe transport
LKEVPSVNVDQDGNVSLRGSEGVKIMIDGRPFGLEGQGRNIILEQIPASNVESIELITNPSAKYEAEGTVGIINVVLKKNEPRGFGYNGTLGFNIGTGDKYNGQFNISLRNNKINLYGNYSYNIRNFISSGYNDRTYFGNSSISSSSQLDSGRMRGKSHLFKIGMDYSIDKNKLLGLSFNYRNSDRPRTNTSFNKQYDMTGNIIYDYYTSSNDLDKGYNYDINANFISTFGKNKQVLTAEFAYSKDKDDETEQNADTYIFPVNNTPDKRNEYSIENDVELTGKIDYVYPVSKDIKIESGYKGSYRKRDTDFKVENFDYNLNQFVTDFNQTNRFVYKEQIHALYGIYTQQLGSFGFSFGLRAEQTFIKGELGQAAQNFDRNYIDFFPSASLSQKLGKSSELQFSYSRRVHRPRNRELNPFRSYMGSNNYRQGNPDLNPEFSDAYEINFIKYFPWATITPGIFYRYTKDEISPSRTLLDSVTTLTMPFNLNSSKSYGGELIINSQPAKFISLNGTLSYYKTEVDASNFQSGLTNSASTWSARGMSSITLPADFMVQLTYFYRGKRVTAQGTMEPFQSFDAAIKKELFDKRLSFSLRVNDIFDNAKFRVEFNDPYFSEVFERRRDSRTITLNITYNFGQKDPDKQRKKKKDSEENNDNEDDGMDF